MNTKKDLKIYFTASLAAKENYLPNYQKIIGHLKKRGADVIADMSAIDATNITLNFTTIDGSAGSNVVIQWEAWAD